MDFIENIKALSARINKKIPNVKTEEATKNALIMPFINTLGYNVFDPSEVMPEFTTDVGTKKGEKVDYAIMKDGKPIMLFECKSVNSDLGKEQASQLYRYFSVSEAVIGVLTNGIEYKFFTDLEEKNKMDLKPFLEFNILKIRDPIVEELKRFRKDSFLIDEIAEAASELKYTKEIKGILGDELNTPSDEFVRFFAKQVYSGMVTKSVHQKFKDITHRAFIHFINEKINDRLQSALDQGKEKGKIVEKVEEVKEDIVTTEEEMEAFYIVRAILQEFVPVERINLKDYKSFCNILLDNKVTQPIVRFHFNTKQMYIGVFDENKKEERIPIDKLSEIYKLKEKIKQTIYYYDKRVSPPPPTPTVNDPEEPLMS